MILLNIRLDSVDNGCGPLNDQWFQTVLLVQVGIHVLLKSLLADSILLTFLVKLDLLRVNINYSVLELLLRQNSILRATYRRRVAVSSRLSCRFRSLFRHCSLKFAASCLTLASYA